MCFCVRVCEASSRLRCFVQARKHQALFSPSAISFRTDLIQMEAIMDLKLDAENMLDDSDSQARTWCLSSVKWKMLPKMLGRHVEIKDTAARWNIKRRNWVKSQNNELRRWSRVKKKKKSLLFSFEIEAKNKFCKKLLIFRWKVLKRSGPFRNFVSVYFIYYFFYNFNNLRFYHFFKKMLKF